MAKPTAAFTACNVSKENGDTQDWAWYYTILVSWKSEIRKFGKQLTVVKSQIIERLFKTKGVSSFTYDTLRKSVAIQPN